jgi:putative membrane protein
MYDSWHNGGWGPESWILMGLMMLLFWGLIAAIVVYAIRSSRQHEPAGPAVTAPAKSDALRILDERFARGEIDVAEYNERRDILRSQ